MRQDVNWVKAVVHVATADYTPDALMNVQTSSAITGRWCFTLWYVWRGMRSSGCLQALVPSGSSCGKITDNVRVRQYVDIVTNFLISPSDINVSSVH